MGTAAEVVSIAGKKIYGLTASCIEVGDVFIVSHINSNKHPETVKKYLESL